MNKISTLLFFFIAINIGYAQKKPVKVRLPSRFYMNGVHWSSITQVSDSLYIAEQENGYDDWFLYLQHLHQNNSTADFEAALPARNKRNELYFFGDENYKRFATMSAEAYQNTEGTPCLLKENGDLPITGLSYEQVTKYCEWLSFRYNSKDNDGFERDSTIANGDYRKGKNRAFGKYLYRVRFRLPTAQEFQVYSELGRYKHKYEFATTKTGYNLKGCMVFNFKRDTLNNCCQGLPSKERAAHFARLKKDLKQGLYRTAYFFPNNLGLSDLQGNVAEMTATKGVACGGSYVHPIEECQIESTNTYTQPEDWLGFRLFVDFILLKSEKK